jgi:hypothetical protein
MALEILDKLGKSEDPSIRYIYMREVLGLGEDDPEVKSSRQAIINSPNVVQMLAGRNSEGTFPWHAYSKWRGAFWTLLQLVDLGYPPGDKSLLPLMEQNYAWLLDADRLKRIPEINGRYRRCALQEASVVLSAIKLDLIDDRVHRLVGLLLKWKWPDGGWNCDKNPTATHSSFYETWLPLRAMHAYGQQFEDEHARQAAAQAAEIFLTRNLYKRKEDGTLMDKTFTQLAFPPYWHYNILVGLQVMGEIGMLGDPRCKDALDLLASKQLPDSGFAAEMKYYQVTDREVSGVSPVKWGPVGPGKSNDHVSVRALGVLKKAGRF